MRTGERYILAHDLGTSGNKAKFQSVFFNDCLCKFFIDFPVSWDWFVFCTIGIYIMISTITF